jgi:hypothetical protein
MYVVNLWSPARPLREKTLKKDIQDVPRRLGLIDAGKCQREFERYQLQDDMHGRCGYVTATGPVDWRESKRTDVFRVILSPADYSEGIATYSALLGDTERQNYIFHLLNDRDPRDFVAQAPPMHLAVNTAVLNADGSKFLGVLRSGAVATARNVWTVGPCETLKLPEEIIPGENPEDCFALNVRSLKEEVGIWPGDCAQSVISWFGYYGPDAHPWITAQVRVELSDKEVKERWHSCHSQREASEVHWFPFNRRSVESVISGARHGPSVEVAEGDCKGTWHIHAPHALHEAWRMRAAWQE